jgi:hypothetical protein
MSDKFLLSIGLIGVALGLFTNHIQAYRLYREIDRIKNYLWEKFGELP